MSDLEGGCLCGAVRYRVNAAPLDAYVCHCRMCQRISGSIGQVCAAVPIAAFAYTRGAPAVYRSSEFGERRFCPSCGASLEFRLAEAPSEVSVNVGTLDDPSAVTPNRHIWWDSRAPWIEHAGSLPKVADGGTPDGA